MKVRGDIIRRKRKKLRMSQSEFARKLHTNRSTVYRWEAMLSEPQVEQLAEILAVLEIDFFDIVRR